jgi:putative FmdB family regulatory protein
MGAGARQAKETEMPTYEYACTSCGHRLEVHQSFSDEPLTTCPECGEPLRKVFGSVGIVLKGPGFYRTDSRNGSAKSHSKEPGEKATASASSESTSSNGSSTDGPASSSAGSSDSSSSGGSGSSTSSGSGSGSSSSSPAAAKTAAS